MACDSETDMKDWIENIKVCAESLQDQVNKTSDILMINIEIVKKWIAAFL